MIRANRIHLSELMLFGVVIVQSLILARGVRPLAARVWELRGVPSLERSARIAFGDEFGGFIGFVRARVPLDESRLVVPGMDVNATFGNVGLMLYFLYPLDIRDCPAGPDLPACVRSYVGEQTYILRVGEFPPADSVPPSKEYSPYSTDLGLYVPRR